VGPAPRPAPEGPGARIGPYKLLQPLGEGGMGTVYLAEQTEPVRRRVALKVIRPGLDSREVIARFEAERQALALMDHPHIARVLDAGTTEAGRPFFAMELVPGLPLTEYCDRNRLTPRERLGLFLPVCRAVQHAHQKGIIHRDLKPSNVLVALADGQPVAKVIDFGVAKALHQRLTDQTLVTRHGAVVGTLQYMAPEQAEAGPLGVDTRSDVYALGVLLYELLTGTTPLGRERLRQAAYDEVLRLIREEEPPKPSTRLSTAGARRAAVAAARRTEPAKLAKLVRGELDWVVMKCLEKDRTRRYETADGLARDLERHLADEPVEAGPPSAGYRLRKAARKHRKALATAAAFALLLVVGAVLSTWQAVRATRAAAAEEAAKEAEAPQRRQAEAAAGLLESVFRGLDPKEAAQDLKGQLVGRLDEAAADLDKEYAGEPLVRARLRNALGLTQAGLGEAGKAVALFRQALEERRAHLGADHPDTLQSMNNLASAYQAAGQPDQALPLFEQVLEKRQVQLGPDHPDTLRSVNNLAWAYQDAGRRDRALPLLEQTLENRKTLLGPDHPDTLLSLNNLASAYQAAGRLDQALPLFEQALAKRRARLGPDHPDTLASLNNLALAYQAAGRPDQALPLFEQALEKFKAKLSADHPVTLLSLNNLATAYWATGQRDKALPLFEQALAKRKKKLDADHPDTLLSLSNLALAYQDTGQLGKALPLLEQALEKSKARLGADHPDTLDSLSNLAGAYGQSGRWAEAESLYREVLAARRRQLPADHPELARALAALGGILLRRDKYAAAEPPLREALHIREKSRPDAWVRFDTQVQLGASLLGQHKYAEAEPLLVQGYQGMKSRQAKFPARWKARLSEALGRLVQLYDAWGQKDEAAKWRKELEALRPPDRGAKR
jgi:tetratricopeptide (TPR) repeat protein/tRNA A-37 threonylcarbamoyl transferase component Bud32